MCVSYAQHYSIFTTATWSTKRKTLVHARREINKSFYFIILSINFKRMNYVLFLFWFFFFSSPIRVLSFYLLLCTSNEKKARGWNENLDLFCSFENSSTAVRGKNIENNFYRVCLAGATVIKKCVLQNFNSREMFTYSLIYFLIWKKDITANLRVHSKPYTITWRRFKIPLDIITWPQYYTACVAYIPKANVLIQFLPCTYYTATICTRQLCPFVI